MELTLITPMAFLGGVLIQCLSLMRKAPPRWSIITFVGMAVYMVLMMGYALWLPQGEHKMVWDLKHLMSPVMSLGMAGAVLYIMVFLKEIVLNIDESVIVSQTLSYWFVLYEARSLLGPGLVAAGAGLGILFSLLSWRLILQSRRVKRGYKYLLYGWYLLVNGFVAMGYFHLLPMGFYSLVSEVNAGRVGPLTLFLLGMLTVHIFFNFGLLYYSVIYSLISPEMRRGLLEQTDRLFEDRQADPRFLRKTLLGQAALFVLWEIAVPERAYGLILLWVMLTPLLMRLIRAVQSRGWFVGNG